MSDEIESIQIALRQVTAMLDDWAITIAQHGASSEEEKTIERLNLRAEELQSRIQAVRQREASRAH